MQQPQSAMHCSESRRTPQKTAASDLPQLLGFIFQMYPPEKHGNVGSTGLLCCSAEIVSIDGNLDVCIPYRTWMFNTPTTSSCASRWAYEVQLDVLLYCWRGVLFTNLMNLSKHHKQHRVIRKIMTITWAPQKMFLWHLGSKDRPLTIPAWGTRFFCASACFCKYSLGQTNKLVFKSNYKHYCSLAHHLI